MSGKNHVVGAATIRRSKIKLTPMTSAVRTALAASVAALALGASGAVFAADCTTAPVAILAPCVVATGIDAAPVVDLTVVADDATLISAGPVFTAIDQSGTGDVVIDNSDPISESSAYDAIAIRGYSSGGNVGITNQAGADLSASSTYGMALGIFGYSATGDVTIDNAADVSATSVYGLADGIFASGADVTVTNGATGSISANGFYWAAGIEAQGTDLTTVTNSGDISAVATANDEYYGIYGSAFGIYATGGAAGVTATNSGAISVDGVYAHGLFIQAGGATAIVNSGDITVGSDPSLVTTYFATGINASSNYENSAIVLDNSGSIAAYGYFRADGIAVAASGVGGTTSVINRGDVSAVSGDLKYGYATGVLASGDSGVDVSNAANGTIYASASYYSFGVQALAFTGNANVTNHGDIEAVAQGDATYALATGVLASSLNGNATVTNTGSIHASAPYSKYSVVYNATGIVASGVAVDVVNRGLIEAAGGRGTGIDAISSTGDITVVNEGSIYADAIKYARGITAFSTYGDVNLSNTADGNIVAVGDFGSYGMRGVSLYGDTGIVNAGSITTSQFGVYAASGNGNVTVINSGSIEGANDFNIFGIEAYVAGDGNVTVDNSGIIDVAGERANNRGILATAYGVGEMSLHNSGTIKVSSVAYRAIGVDVTAGGDISVGNDGEIAATGAPDSGTSISGRRQSMAKGIRAVGDSVDVANGTDGSITSNAFAFAHGIEAQGTAHATVINHGDISATAMGNDAVNQIFGQAFGISAAGGTVTVTNGATGSISADAFAWAAGIHATSADGDVTVGNSGSITATATAAYGVANGILANAYGDVTINNAGQVVAVAGNPTGFAAAVQMASLNGASTLNNSGSLGGQGAAGYAWAVFGSAGVETVNNTGTVNGAVSLLGGDDVFNNNARGLWDVGSTRSTDFGDGDDTITNAAGGTIRLAGGAIQLGSSVNGDAFNNAGRIQVVGGDNLIHMGTGPVALVPSLNPLALVNTGIIDFVDGDTNDMLTIVGDLGGNGALNIDLDLSGLSSDVLYVDGSMVNGAVQTVNVSLAGLPTTASATPVTFANVSGVSAAGSFVAGDVLGASPGNFIAMDVAVTQPTANAFAVGIDVVGLQDSGTLAAAVASGAANMLNTQIGTFTQRMGVNPFGDEDKVLSAYVRGYTSEGDVDPAHQAFNFGQGGNFAYNQKSSGREIGLNANLAGNLHVGLTLGSADGRQTLTGNGVGQNRLDGNTVGLYATWFAPQGLYVDVSNRKMAVDVHSTSAAGTLPTRVRSNAWNLEAGYQWSLAGLSVVPQLQYTLTKVEDVRPIIGDQANFEAAGGTASRARVGVEVSKTFQAGDVRWMPYGSLNAIRQSDGELRYTVADTFVGSTSTDGTSAMAELGLGVQKGRWGLSIGANWTDGGAFDSTVGGQAVVRVAW